jgi:anti-sigma B factor antagonist
VGRNIVTNPCVTGRIREPMDKDKKSCFQNLFSVTRSGDVTVVKFCFNELGLEQREYLKNELYSLVPAGDRYFVLDLSKVGFLSSLVIALIVFFAKEIRKNKGNIKLCGLSGEAFSIFQITQLDKVFELYETEHDALESFKKTS